MSEIRPSRPVPVSRKPIAAILVGATLVLGVAQHEGFRDKAYFATQHEKQQGISTIGYGSTYHPDGTPVKQGETITRAKAEEYLKGHIESYKKIMAKCVKVPLHEKEFEAYASLAYNIGPTAFCNSTLVKVLNTGDYQGACKQILRWDKQNGKVLRGLTVRREHEYRLCISASN